MDGVELTQMMSKAMESIKSMLDIDSVVGKPYIRLTIQQSFRYVK